MAGFAAAAFFTLGGGADAASFANAIAVAANAVEHDLIGRTRGLIAAAAVPR